MLSKEWMFLFSGILSYLEAIAEEKIKNNECTSANLCYSLQESVFPMLVEIIEQAMAHTDKKDVLIVGGAGCSEPLQEMMRIMCSNRGGSLFTTDDMYCVDNGAMIVYTGLVAFANGMSTSLEDSTFTQRFRTDEVLAIWRERKRNLQMVSWKKESNYLHVSRASKYGVVIGNKEGVICQVAKQYIQERLMKIYCELSLCDKLCSIGEILKCVSKKLNSFSLEDISGDNLHH